jgi:hypothetical protein
MLIIPTQEVVRAWELLKTPQILSTKKQLCAGPENTCYFVTVNCASEGSPRTSAFVRADGTLLGYQPYGRRGLLIADIYIHIATVFWRLVTS